MDKKIIFVLIFIYLMSLPFIFGQEKNLDFMTNFVDYKTNEVKAPLADSSIELSEDISYLNEVQIKKLAELNEKKINENKRLNVIKKQDENIELNGWNIINPVAYAKKAVNIMQKNSQEDTIELIEKDISSYLEEYGVPAEFQEEIDSINEKANTWTSNYNSVYIKSQDYKNKIASGLKDMPIKNMDSNTLGVAASDKDWCVIDGVCDNVKLKVDESEDQYFNYRGNLYEVATYVRPCGSMEGCIVKVKFEVSNDTYSQETQTLREGESIMLIFGFPLSVKDIKYEAFAEGEASAEIILGELEYLCPSDCKASIPSDQISESFDWRNVSGKNYVTDVKNQGNCGSCWAFGVLGALEGMTNAYYNNPNINADLSEQDLVSCSYAGTCNGGWADEALRYVKEEKTATESKFPYSATDESCSNKAANWNEDAWSLISWSNVPFTTEEIKKALKEKGPLATGMAVYYDFFSYTEGIYHHTTENLAGYHAIVIVGYGVYDGATYWIVKNSWGENWGEEGYFRIFAGDSYIDSFFIHAIDEPLPYPPKEKICEDKDSDGYCNWGLGDKPESCPVCDDSIGDCDDANPDIFEDCGIKEVSTGKLNITSNPSQADIYILDINTDEYIFRGKTPLITDLNTGKREIKISKEGYFENVTSINISAGEFTDLNPTLGLIPVLTAPFNNDVFRPGENIKINGSIQIEGFQNYEIDWSKGFGRLENRDWNSLGITLMNEGLQQISDRTLGIWDTSFITEADFYTLRLNVKTEDKTIASYVHSIYFDPSIKEGWPVYFNFYNSNTVGGMVADLENDGFQEIMVIDDSIAINENILQIYVYNNEGYLKWSKETDYTTSLYSDPSIITADVNDDGFLEVFLEAGEYLYGFDYKGNRLSGEWPFTLGLGEQVWFENTIIADLDNNGKKEILLTASESLGYDLYKGYQYNEFLTIIDDMGNIIKRIDLGPDYHCPMQGARSRALGNFDDDAELEIVVKYGCYGIAVYDIDGSLLPGWPKETGGFLKTNPVTGDINNDGYSEIIVSAWDISKYYNDYENYHTSAGGIYIFNKNGSLLASNLLDKHFIDPGFALADLNKDDYLEIVVSDEEGNIHLLDHNGSEITGWPRQMPPYHYNFASYPGITDINNDGNLDILFSAGGIQPDLVMCGETVNSGGIVAFDFSGNRIDLNSLNFTEDLFLELFSNQKVFITDLESDGKLDLVTISYENKEWCPLNSLNAPRAECSHEDEIIDDNCFTKYDKGRNSIYSIEFDVPYSYSPWSQFQHDSQHTGCYDCNEIKSLSKIINNEDYPITGNLNLKLQKEVNFTWETISEVVDQQLTIPGLSSIDISDYWNSQDIMANEAGNHRIHGIFEVPGEEPVEYNWKFSVESSIPNVECYNDSDCPPRYYYICDGNSSLYMRDNFLCLNPGMVHSSCFNLGGPFINQTECSFGCENGVCL